MKQGVLLGIALGSLVIAASAGILSQLAGAPQQEAVPSAGVTEAGPVVVRVAAGTIAYRPLGNFSHNGKTVTPALTELPVEPTKQLKVFDGPFFRRWFRTFF